MITKTGKDIISPIAEAVSALIVLNSDAEIRNVGRCWLWKSHTL